jgi:hypothetical protein
MGRHGDLACPEFGVQDQLDLAALLIKDHFEEIEEAALAHN